MKFSHELRYDAAPSDVHAMLAEEAFRAKACEAAGNLRCTVDVTPAGDGMAVVVDQTQAATGIPSFAKKFVGEEIQIVQRERWAGPVGADLTLEIPGKPGRFTGTITLAPDGSGGTVETVAGEVKVNMPLVGGRLEGLISDLLRSALKSENRAGVAWLDGGG